MSDFSARVYELVRRVPPGRVVSYGGVAALLGRPRAARGVGRALRELPEGHDVPWWRVVNHAGEISVGRVDPHAARLQRVLLETEGVAFDGRGRIDWDRYGWAGPHGDARSGAPGGPAA
ncbi:MAG TPA: MGMT family protein [Longimicrobiales bacterium]